MPLHADHEALQTQFNGLDHVVYCCRDNYQPARHSFQALMVARIYEEFIDPQDRSQLTVGCDCYRVGIALPRMPVSFYVLVQCAAESGVHQLQSPANREDGEVAVQGLAQQSQLHGVASMIRADRLRVACGAVYRGIDITSSSEYQTIECCERRGVLDRLNSHGIERVTVRRPFAFRRTASKRQCDSDHAPNQRLGGFSGPLSAGSGRRVVELPLEGPRRPVLT